MRHVSIENLNPAKAAIMFDMAVKMGKLTRNDVDEIDGQITNEITTLEQRLTALRGPSNGSDTEAPQRLTVRQATPAAKPGRKAKTTPEQLANRQLQGKYLALVRQIPASRRARFSKIAKKDGREAAIKEMQKQLGQ